MVIFVLFSLFYESIGKSSSKMPPISCRIDAKKPRTFIPTPSCCPLRRLKMSSCSISCVWWDGSTPLAVSQVLTHPHLNSCVSSRMLRVNVSLPSGRSETLLLPELSTLEDVQILAQEVLEACDGQKSCPHPTAPRTHCTLVSRRWQDCDMGESNEGSLGNPRSAESRGGSGHKKRCFKP